MTGNLGCNLREWVVGLASRSTEGRASYDFSGTTEVHRYGDHGCHCEQCIGNSINQDNAENGHGDEGKA